MSLVWWRLCPARGVSPLEPEHAQEGCVLTGGLERRTARDAQKARRRLPPVVRELPSSGRPEEGREQERGQKDGIHRAFFALLRLPPEHDELAPARLVPVYPLAHVRARRRGGGDLGSASRPGKKGSDAEQEGGDRYERSAADEPPRQRKPHDPCIVNHAREHAPREPESAFCGLNYLVLDPGCSYKQWQR